MEDLDARVRRAVRHFWRTLRDQERKGKERASSGGGRRGAVTGGKQLDGFVDLLRDILVESGVPDVQIFGKQKRELPGFFRPTKQWDLLVVDGQTLLAVIELKSQVGSFGNNFNNRLEEAVGSATDLLKAYRDGAFLQSPRPWLGYLMLLEDTEKSTRPVNVLQPHFAVLPEFQSGLSYAGRYEIFCQKLVREQLYDAACLLLSPRNAGNRARYVEPSAELSFERFATLLSAHASAFARLKG